MIFGKNVLVMVAHPDDEVLGAGGTIPLIKQAGGQVTVVVATEGSSTQYADNVDLHAQKRSQAERANDILGVDELVLWNFPDMRLDTVPHAELNLRIEQFIRSRSFDTVLTHSASDVNLDHQMVHCSVLVATRPYPGQPVRRLLTFWVNSATEWGARSPHRNFWPNVFIDIGDTIHVKLKAMGAYEVELRDPPHPRSLEGLRLQARARGSEVGVPYAEPFQLLLAHGPLSLSP